MFRRILAPIVILSAVLSAAETWTALGLGGGGGMHAPAVSPHDPKLMFVNCDMNGVYRSADGGESWQLIPLDQLCASTLCPPLFHATDPNIIYAASDSKQLVISRDRGRTWQALLAKAPWGRRKIMQLATDAAQGDFLLIGFDGSAYASCDGGKNWWECTGLQGVVTSFHIDQTSPPQRRVCFAGTSKGVFRSSDGGKTWESRSIGLPADLFTRDSSSGVRSLDYDRAGWKHLRLAGGSDAKSGVTQLYVALASRSSSGKLSGGVYRSSDRGESWQSVMTIGINTDVNAADKYASGPCAQYAFPMTTNAKPHTVYVVNSNTGLQVPHHTSVYRSDDAGASWRAVLFSNPAMKEFNIQPDYLLTNGFADQDPARFASINPANPEMLLYCNDVQTLLTHNGGRTWTPLHSPAAEPGKHTACNGLVVTTTWHYYIDPFEAQRHYIAYTDIGLARSLDAGKSWQWWSKEGRAPWPNTCYELAFDPEVPGKLWGAFSQQHDIPNKTEGKGAGGVCLSLDFGASWKACNEKLPAAPVTSLVLDPGSPKGSRVLYAALYKHGLYKSNDDGRSWTSKSKGLGSAHNQHVSRLWLHADGSLFALITGKSQQKKFVGGAGLYRSNDGGEHWQCLNTSQALLWPKDFSVDPRDSQRIYLGACDANDNNEGGLYQTRDGGQHWQRIARRGTQHFGATVHPKKDWIYMTLCEDPPQAGLWLSRDGGQSWSAFKSLPFRNIHRVEFDSRNDEVIYVTTFGGGVWRGPTAPD